MTQKVPIAIIGATGYTGQELLRLLAGHPFVDVILATSETYSGKTLGEVCPHLEAFASLKLESLNPDILAKKASFAFSCLPHQSAMKTIPLLIEKGTKVVDLSADFRFNSATTYATWYADSDGPSRHHASHLLAESVYGLPELHRQKIKKSFLVGNPGCYPTAILLALIPLVQKQDVSLNDIICDAKSGASGAGRKASLDLSFCEINESMHPYNPTTNRHTGEIEQELSQLADKEIHVTFVPHLIPIDRGILATCYLTPLRKYSDKDLQRLYAEFYKKEPFVRVNPSGITPKTKNVRGTNMCEIGITINPRTEKIIVMSAIDNLTKGASGQAIQNMNLMHGWEETTGLP